MSIYDLLSPKGLQLDFLEPIKKWMDRVADLETEATMQFATLLLIVFSIALLVKYYEFSSGKKIFENNVIRKQMRKEEDIFRQQKLKLFYRNIFATISYQKRKLGLDFTQDWKKDEIEYILQRNKKKSWKDDEYMRFDEWSALQILRYTILIIITIILFLISNRFIAIAVFVCGLFGIKFGILYIYISKVRSENYKIMEEFGDFYLVQHHLLLSDTTKPFEKGLNIYKDIAKNKATQNFINIALYFIKRENGELGSIRKLKSLYRDIPSLQSLLTLEEQKIGGSSIVGGNIEEDANGIRRQVIEEKERYIEDRALAIQNHIAIIRYCVYVLLFVILIVGAVAVIPPILGVRV